MSQSFNDPNQILRFAAAGSSVDELMKASPLGPTEVIKIFHSACHAVHRTHTLISSNDIKIENLRFDGEGRVQLCDPDSTSRFPLDIWKLGCLLYYLCYRVHPFGGSSPLLTTNASWIFPADEEFFFKMFIPLINSCLNRNPGERPSISQLVARTKTLAADIFVDLDSPVTVVVAESKQSHCKNDVNAPLYKVPIPSQVKADKTPSMAENLTARITPSDYRNLVTPRITSPRRGIVKTEIPDFASKIGIMGDLHNPDIVIMHFHGPSEVHTNQTMNIAQRMSAVDVVGTEESPVTGTRKSRRAKRRRDSQMLVLRDAEIFNSIDDVILEFRSIQGYVAPVMGDAFQQILKRLEKSNFVRVKKGQDVSSDSDNRIISMNDIREVRRLVDQYVGKSNRAEFDEKLDKITANNTEGEMSGSTHRNVSGAQGVFVLDADVEEPEESVCNDVKAGSSHNGIETGNKPVAEGKPTAKVVPIAVQELEEEELANGTVKKSQRKSVPADKQNDNVGTRGVGTEESPPIPTTRKSSKPTSNGYALGVAADTSTLVAARGLPNLGNTCFFNSVMQCLMHTHHLKYYFQRLGRIKKLEFTKEKTVVVDEEKVDLGPATIECSDEAFIMNDVLRGFLSEFLCGTAPSPNNVFSEISRKAPRFRGWQQQDAHELLKYLLDRLRSEEQERYKVGIAHFLGLPSARSKTKIDPAIVNQAKGYLQAAGRPLLDAVFGGTLLQTIRCSECGHVSERYEQFLDLSIPLSANPMAARSASDGRGTVQMSAHQKKKAAKLAKKNDQRQARQIAAKRNTSTSMGKTAEDSGETDDIFESVEFMDLSDDSGSDTELEEEVENIKTAGQDPLDYTKVLVFPPSEYSRERSIGSFLLEFTAEERLAGPNAYECEKCCAPRNKKVDAKGNHKKRVEALKRYLIFEPPSVLTLHLKRFQQIEGITGRLSTRKLGGHVAFPALFDIAPFCCKNVERIAAGQKRVVYSLYGVVVHSGDLGGGHYIAYVKSRHPVEQAKAFLEAARSGCVDSMIYPPTCDIITARPDEKPKSPDGQWYYCSDSTVETVDESVVMAAEAYILFYERVM